jgi:hypothetical protein
LAVFSWLNQKQKCCCYSRPGRMDLNPKTAYYSNSRPKITKIWVTINSHLSHRQIWCCEYIKRDCWPVSNYKWRIKCKASCSINSDWKVKGRSSRTVYWVDSARESFIRHTIFVSKNRLKCCIVSRKKKIWTKKIFISFINSIIW